jgi:excisionase family DNA binding protein
MNPAEKFLTIDDLRERLKCGRTTVWRLINERGLKAIRSGGLIRVAESEFVRWVAKHTTGSGDEGGVAS